MKIAVFYAMKEYDSPIIPDERLQRIAEKMKKLRIELGYKSYEMFANAKMINRVQYGRYENGKGLTVKNLLRVLDGLGVSLKDFFSDID